MMLKVLLLLILVALIIQEVHGRRYKRQRRHHNRKKEVSSWRHSYRYRDSKTTRYGSYRQGRYNTRRRTQYGRYRQGRYTTPRKTQYGSYREGRQPTPVRETTTPVDRGQSIRLPLNLYPFLYDLELQPFMYETNASDFYFIGKVRIDMECKRSTNEIVLHSDKLIITSVRIQPMSPGQSEIIPTIEFDTVKQFLILKTTTQLVSGSKYSVFIEFRGPIISELGGLFQTTYQRGNDTIYVVQTQMAPYFARKVIPCFDEPAVKAKFRVTLIRKKHLISLSNSVKTRSLDLTNDWVADHYADTPLMSTYLLAFVVCDFKSRDVITSKNVLFRIWTRPAAFDQSGYVSDLGSKVLTFYEEYFKYPFMLPKQDVIGVPDFLGSMENWGLIIQREEAMSYIPQKTSEIFKEFVTNVLSHELSHVWFGNLVSPSWWDDLWLNEGFASYIAYVAMNSVVPSWLPLDDYVISDVQPALAFDGLISSHPLYVPVTSADGIDATFDVISYNKGGSIFRMLQFIVGDATFRKGIQRLIREKEYGVMGHDDFWEALRKQSIMDGNSYNRYNRYKNYKPLDVKGIMDTWTLQMNYPTVFMERKGYGMKLSQSRYLLDKTATDPGTYSSPFGYKWEIPFTFTTQTIKDFDQDKDDIIWMRKDGADVFLPRVKCGNGWFIGNIRQYGFYRVNYPEDNWVKLIDQLKTDHTVIHPVNRAQIINDAWSLAKSGDLSMKIALQTLEYLSMEDSNFPFDAAGKELTYVRNMLESTDIYADLSAFLSKTYSPPLMRLGYNNTGSGHLEKLLRSLVLREACRYGDQNCINFAINSFQNLMTSTGNTNPIDVELRSIVYNAAIQYGGQAEWDFAYKGYTTSNTGSERILFIYACTYTQNVTILNSFLQLILTDAVRKQDGENILRLVSRNPVGNPLVWNLLTTNWDVMITRFVTLNYLIPDVTAKFNTAADLQSIQDFKNSQPNLGASTAAFDRAIETTRANIKWMSSNFQIIKDWLQTLP
ncbi:aminopeptidase N [Mytilus galloprovincialis]|uniref:Aminopeptidase n=2 Tax=Mytilus galloprovincialis TaxID=29158 RepID=A0A8B6HMQ9_MYTGA|nr:aminopeptidase N [Mytilus galloprovincialis]